MYGRAPHISTTIDPSFPAQTCAEVFIGRLKDTCRFESNNDDKVIRGSGWPPAYFIWKLLNNIYPAVKHI